MRLVNYVVSSNDLLTQLFLFINGQLNSNCIIISFQSHMRRDILVRPVHVQLGAWEYTPRSGMRKNGYLQTYPENKIAVIERTHGDEHF
jgi:hypothetical protein